MKTKLAVLGVFIITCAFAGQTSWRVDQLADHIYKFTADGGGYDIKVIASIGPDGILLVDTGAKSGAEDLKELILSYGKGLPEYVIFTHAHVEHTTGNYIFGPEPILIGQANLPNRLQTGSYLFDEFPAHSIPELTFEKEMVLNFNGESIRLIAYPGGHDDSDIIVWFTESKVVCVGAISNGRHFPSIDGTSGDIRKYRHISAAVYDLLPEDVQIIPGHGEDGSMEDFANFNDMLQKTWKLVEDGIAAGKELKKLQEENLFAEFESYGGSYTSTDKWIEYVYRGQTETGRDESLKSIYDPVYYAIRDKGATAGIKVYNKIKREDADQYVMKDNFLMVVGYKLYSNSKYDQSKIFFKADLKENQGAPHAWISNYYLGLGSIETGNNKQARKYLKAALMLNPDSQDIKDKLAELE